MEPGQIVGEKYKVIRELGRGAMGAVFEVEHVYIKKRFALKSINAELAKNPEFRARALRESQASAAIRHPNIVDVSDFGETKDGAPYIVMEFLDGRPLTDLIEEQAPMQVLTAFRITIEILEGLQAAHDAGIVHRDIKPDNIFVLTESTPDSPRIKIVDFGISKMKTSKEGMTLTRTNAVMGTPYYMSLEQCRGAKDVDGRADLFSVGVILFELLSRRIPFEADTFAELVVKMVKAERTPLAEAAPWLPDPVISLVEKSTAVERTNRFNSAAEMLAEMHRLVDTLPDLDAPIAPVMAAKPVTEAVSGTTATTYESLPGRHPASSVESGTKDVPSKSQDAEDVGPGHDASTREGEVTEQVELPIGYENDLPQLFGPSRRWLWPGLAAGLVIASITAYFVFRSGRSQSGPSKSHAKPVVLLDHDAGSASSSSADAGRAPIGTRDESRQTDASAPQTVSDAGAKRDAAEGKARHTTRPRRSRHRRARARTRSRQRHRANRRFRLKTDD